jgi:hypothetical protein
MKTCQNCKKTYKYNASYKKHVKACKIIFIQNNYVCRICNTKFKYKCSYTKHMNVQHPQPSHIQNVQNIQNIQNNINIQQNNIHIHINPFKFEDLSMLTNDEWKRIFFTIDHVLPNFVKKIHIDTEVNRNIYIKNVNSKYYQVIKGEKLQYLEEALVLKNILGYHVDTLHEKLDDMMDNRDFSTGTYMRIKHVLEAITHDPDKKLESKMHVKRILLNNRELVKQHLDKFIEQQQLQI